MAAIASAAVAIASAASSPSVVLSPLAASQPIYVQVVGGSSGWKDLVPVATALLGAAVALVANWLSNRHSRKLAELNLQSETRQKGAELRLERLEELHVLFDAWQLHLQQLYLWYLRCYAGKLEFKVILEEVKKHRLPDGDLQRLNVLVALYVPGLKDSYERVQAARAANVQFLGDPKETLLTKGAFIEQQNAFGRAANQFLSELAAEARKYVEALKA